MRIIFMGAPEFAVASLKSIIAAGSEIAAVFSKAPSHAGRRGLQVVKSPVHNYAESLGIPVFTPRSLRDVGVLQNIRAAHADAIVVAAYGLLLPKEILAEPRLYCLNVHASLLPRWRGAAPIQRAIMAGDPVTGVSIMKMEPGLDTGPVCLVENMLILPSMTAGDLTTALAEQGGRLIVDALRRAEGPGLSFHEQDDSLATYAKKIEKAELPIDWRQNSNIVLAQIHAFSPAPGAFTLIETTEGVERIKCLRAEKVGGLGKPGQILDDRLTICCADGALQIISAQRQGKTVMNGEELQRGAHLRAGSIFRS